MSGIKGSAADDTPVLPSHYGPNLLLKLLQLEHAAPLVLKSLPDAFDRFVAPLDEGLRRPRQRVLGYLVELQIEGFARIRAKDGGSDSLIVEATEVGLLNAQGIGLSPVLQASWEQRKAEGKA